jgi:hypothetical protein
MPVSTDNIEPLARAICRKGLSRSGWPDAEVDWMVERFWHCVAAQIDAGLIDDNGETIRHSLEDGEDAYVDWRKRHPDYVLPPRIRPQAGLR